jgi:membrane-bound acyltransferase YfiQ involved in biofilm formation
MAEPLHIAILSYFFFVIGIVAARNKEKIISFVGKWKYIVIPMGLISGIYVYWEGRGRYFLTDNYLSYYSQWRPSVLLYVILVGAILFYIFDKPRVQNSLLQRMSKFSFLVFFLHVIVLEGIWSIFGKNLFSQMSMSAGGKIIFDLLLFGVVAGVSFIASFVLHKIPKLNSLTG